MNFKLENGYIILSCEISCINVVFSEDRENMPGVCRMTGVEIQCDEEVSSDILSEVEDRVYNYFADREYFTEDPNWTKEAENEICDYTGVSYVNIEFE